MCLVIQSNLTLNSPSWYWNNFDKENNLFTTWFDTSLFWCYLSDVNHPWLFIFCHLSLDNEKCFDSEIYWKFLSHNMFRPSGPDHVLAWTDCKLRSWISIQFWFEFSICVFWYMKILEFSMLSYFSGRFEIEPSKYFKANKFGKYFKYWRVYQPAQGVRTFQLFASPLSRVEKVIKLIIIRFLVSS